MLRRPTGLIPPLAVTMAVTLAVSAVATLAPAAAMTPTVSQRESSATVQSQLRGARVEAAPWASIVLDRRLSMGRPATTIDTADRAAVVAAYRTELQPLLSLRTGWTGSVATCDPGTVSARNQRAVRRAVNYVRGMAGLMPVTMDPDLSVMSQAAALIMLANSTLTHTPDSSMTCWTKAGSDGAGHGNLTMSWGYEERKAPTGARAVVGYMTDSGDNNTPVGHRRWLLYPGLKVIGNGDTTAGNSIYVVSNRWRTVAPSWVSWPTAGFFPRELEPEGRWSVSYPKADFSGASVQITRGSTVLPVSVYPTHVGYGENTLVWEVDLPSAYLTSAKDITLRVRVSGIVMPSGTTVTKSWRTTLVTAAA